MAAMSIRNIDDEDYEWMRVRAARHGRSMEAEMRAVIAAVRRGDQGDRSLMTEWRRTFAELGGVELDIPPRTDLPGAPDLRE